MSSYTHYLQPFLPYVPSSLISTPCLEKIVSVTRHLPATLGLGPFMFECSLDDRPDADFSVAVVASRGDLALLSRLRPPGRGWGRIGEFAGSCADASSVLNRTTAEVWLEYDVCLTRNTDCDIPGVFFDVGSTADHLRAAEEGLNILGERRCLGLLPMLIRSSELLPAPARILFVGVMIPRDTGTIRLVASGLSLDDIVVYLRRLGLHRSIGHLPTIEGIAAMTDHTWLAIDIDGKGVTPRIGFDFYQSADSPTEGGETWADLLAFLVSSGICTDRKRAAVLQAADMSLRVSDASTWPEDVRRSATILGPAGFNRLTLGIHHIKVIDGPSDRLKAKAYLCGRYR